jgi:hyaluronan synthase
VEADVFVTLDSDTVLEHDAIAECLRPFGDPDVHGVAALILGYNWRHNALTRLIDLEFVSSFLVGRAAMSRLGTVLVTCGSLAAYRASVCRDNLEAYVGQTFLGVPVRSGDDRRLTQFALLRGRVVFQESAIARAALPESIGQLARQRTRWFLSFYRGTTWGLAHFPRRGRAFWLTGFFAIAFAVQTVLLVALFVFASRIDWSFVALGIAVYVGVVSYLRAARYVAFRRADMATGAQLAVYALSPLVSLLYLVFLTPLRYYAMTRLRTSHWRTRAQVEPIRVEPALDARPTAPVKAR